MTRTSDSAYRSGYEAMDHWIKTSEFLNRPYIPKGPEDETPITVTPTEGGIFRLFLGSAFMAMTYQAPIATALVLGSTGLVIGSPGILLLTKDTTFPRRVAGHCMALAERVSQVFQCCFKAKKA